MPSDIELPPQLYMPRKTFEFGSSVLQNSTVELLTAKALGAIGSSSAKGESMAEDLESFWAREHACYVTFCGNRNLHYNQYLPGRWYTYSVIAQILRRLQRDEHTSLLEVGCGSALTSQILSQSGWKSVGMDWTRCAVNFARALASDLGSGVENVVGNAVALPFADRAFDMIFSLGMLEHQPPERQLGIVREMSRVARTAVVLSVPNVDSPIFLAMEEREHTSIPAGLIYPEQNVQHGVDLERLAQLASLRVAESAAVHIVPPRRIPGRLLSKDSHRFFSRTIDEASRSWCGNAIQTWQRVEQNCSLEEKRRFGWFSYVVALTNESGG